MCWRQLGSICLTRCRCTSDSLPGPTDPQNRKPILRSCHGKPMFGVRTLQIIPPPHAQPEVPHTARNGFLKESSHIQAMIDCWSRYNALAEACGVPSLPKNHLMLHLLHRSLWLGSPWEYACWYDEGLNRTLKLLLRGCHSKTFEVMAFAKSTHVLDQAAEKRSEKAAAKGKAKAKAKHAVSRASSLAAGRLVKRGRARARSQ